MPLRYTGDVLIMLNDAGYNTGYLRKEKLLSESTIHNIRHDKSISWSSLEMICRMLKCQPSYLIYFEEENEPYQ